MMTVASRNTSPAMVCLGRLGDLTAAMPIAHEISYQTGQPTAVITCREYLPFLEAFSYVTPVAFEGPFHKIGKARLQFERRYCRLHVAQMYSTDEGMPEQVTKSFVTDAWHRAGMLPKFGLPLVVDRRDARREQALLDTYGLSRRVPYVVVHAGGITSPYAYRHDLLNALRGLNVIDITAMRAEKPQDLLAVLENAACAVLADSFPLHLSFAVPNLPVVALVTDKPGPWFGSPRRPNWIASYRYEESRVKMKELATAVTRALVPVVEEPDPFFPKGAYNASLIDYHGKPVFTWRHHPGATWETRLRGSRGEGSFPIEVQSNEASSHEDARLFIHDGKLHLSYTLAKMGDSQRLRDARCVVEYGELVMGRNVWRVKHPHRVKVGANDWSGMEKNHVFWSQDGRLFCLYGSEPDQRVLEVQGNDVVAEHRTGGARWNFGAIRGDVIVPYNGKLLRVFHSLYRYSSGKFRYHIGALKMEATPPFRIISITPAPVFSGNESRPKTVAHSKPNVVFTCGAVVDGEDLIVALSRDDDSAELVRVNINRLGL